MEIKPAHDDGSDHDPDWASVMHADVPHDEALFDVWCRSCRQSGSFRLEATDVQWYP